MIFKSRTEGAATLLLMLTFGASGASGASAQRAPTSNPQSLAHVQKMRAAMPAGLRSNLGDRLYGRLFDVDQQIRTARQSMNRLQSEAVHGSLTEQDAKRLELYRSIFNQLKRSKVALAEVHTQIAKCMTECTLAEDMVAPREDAAHSEPSPRHRRKMAERMTLAAKARSQLDASVFELLRLKARLDGQSLESLQQKLAGIHAQADRIQELEQSGDSATTIRVLLRDEPFLQLIEYMSGESRYLGDVLDLCGQSTSGTPGKEQR